MQSIKAWLNVHFKKHVVKCQETELPKQTGMKCLLHSKPVKSYLDTAEDLSAELARSHGFFTGSEKNI